MEKKKLITSLLLVALMGGALSGCVTTDDGSQGVELIEGMSELDFNRWMLYTSLTVKIGANRLLKDEVINLSELNLAADVLEAVRDEPVVPGTTSLIAPALEGVGLTNVEVELLLLIVEQELLARGALDWVDPETGLIDLSPRSKQLLTAVADALRSAAGNVTEEEAKFVADEE